MEVKNEAGDSIGSLFYCGKEVIIKISNRIKCKSIKNYGKWQKIRSLEMIWLPLC